MESTKIKEGNMFIVDDLTFIHQKDLDNGITRWTCCIKPYKCFLKLNSAKQEGEILPVCGIMSFRDGIPRKKFRNSTQLKIVLWKKIRKVPGCMISYLRNAVLGFLSSKPGNKM